MLIGMPKSRHLKAQEIACQMTGQSAPRFKDRWWHNEDRIDIRPVCWSLRNRPDDWSKLDYVFRHNPTEVDFWHANGFWCLGIYRAPGLWRENRANGKLSFIQKWQFQLAMNAWERQKEKEVKKEKAKELSVREKFAAHFQGQR